LKTETVKGPGPKSRIRLGDIHRKSGAFPDRKKEEEKNKCRKKILV